MPTLVHLWRCSSLTAAWFRARSDGIVLNRFPYHFLLARLGDMAAKDTCNASVDGVSTSLPPRAALKLLTLLKKPLKVPVEFFF